MGKSTIAKAIFFFRTIKDDILDLIIKQTSHLNDDKGLQINLEKLLKTKFLDTFGSSWGMSDEMQIQYEYGHNTYVRVSLTPDESQYHRNFVQIHFSANIKDFLAKPQNRIKFPLENDRIKEASEQGLAELFCDSYETVFIPAGRSMITLLTNQLNYFFTSMDEVQKRNIDYGTRNYIERILKVKPEFSGGMEGLLFDRAERETDERKDELFQRFLELSDGILKGKYRYVNGEERLDLSEWKYVKINYASSGQQEAVWILNLIYYYLIRGKKIHLILEEPESHLFPDSQKYIAELIGLTLNAGNQAFVTTHSPYILGEFNNLMYGYQVRQKYNAELSEVLNENELISPDGCNAFFVTEGGLRTCKDRELNLIQNEVIDGASDQINDENDAIHDLKAELQGYTVHIRIPCEPRTHAVRSSGYQRFRERHGGRVRVERGQIEEDI